MSQARYSSSELRAVNERNPNRLPPATAVHGMAMYELQRGAEQERLFHHAMFDISALKQTSAAQLARTDSLERAVKACASHHDNERPVSLAGVQSVHHALTSFSPTDTDPKAAIKRANWLLNELDQEAISTEDQVALTTILSTNLTHQTKMDLQKAILHLRDDHTRVANDLLEATIRISKLEDNVRALTAQRSAPQDSPRMAQEIEAITRYGGTVVLKIPKGQALVPLRASRSLTLTPPVHSADSAPNSQVSEEDVTTDGADQTTSSQSTSEASMHPEDPKIQTLEKPLPPIPAAAAFPATSYIKPEPLGNTWDSGNFQSFSATLEDNVHTTTSFLGASTLSAIPPVQIAPNTPRVGEESAPVPRSKGKGKKKWTDPPIFQDSQTSAGGYDTGDDTKTLLSYHEGAETSTTARDTTVRSEVHEQKIAHPETMSPVRDVTNQTTASRPLELKSLAHQSGSSRTESSNNKRLFKDLIGHNRSNHEQPPPSHFTSTQTSAQTAPATTPAPTRVFSSPGAMRSVMQSVAAGGNYVTTPEAATASRENAVPRAPVNITVTTPAAGTASEENAVTRDPVIYKIRAPQVSGRTGASVSSDASGSSAKTGRIAKRSAIKKVDAGSSSEQPGPAQPTAILSPPQFLSPEPRASTTSSAAAPQMANVLTPNAEVTTPAATERHTMNARVASFHPSKTFTAEVTRTASPAVPGGTIMASLRQQMTPEAFARFSQQKNNVQTWEHGIAQRRSSIGL